MIRIITLDWSGVSRKKVPYVTSKLVKFSLNFGGMLSDCNTFFVVDGLDDPRKFDILNRIFKCNGLKGFEDISIMGDGQGRLF